MPGLTGRLDQRLRLYSYTPSESAGVVTEGYTYQATRWGAIEPPSGREVTMGAAGRERVDGVATFKAEVLVDPGLGSRWMVKEESAAGWATLGGWWRVLSVLPRRRQQVVQCLLQWADDAQSTVEVVS